MPEVTNEEILYATMFKNLKAIFYARSLRSLSFYLRILAAAAAAREAAVEREGILDAAPVPTQRAEERVAEIHLGGMGFNQVRNTFFAIWTLMKCF